MKRENTAPSAMVKKQFVAPTIGVKNINTSIICGSDPEGGIRSASIRYGGTTSLNNITSADSKRRGAFNWD